MDPEASEGGRRDLLARVRTDLANERTLLAYIRTSLMSAGSGLTLLKFFADLPWARSVGWTCLVMGAAIVLLGIVRFVALRSSLKRSG